jgi:hypothetical protein
MKLNNKHLQKIDFPLKQALQNGKEDQILRAVIVLGSENIEDNNVSVSPELDPRQYFSRQDYRRAMIEQRQSQLADEIGKTLKELQDLRLAPRGGNIGRMVVVQGTARQILNSLELPGVRRAALDHPITIAGSTDSD